MLEFLVEKSNLKENDRIAVGVSGGADSMVLLWALLDLQKKVKFYLKVININHNIRGAESDRDSLFVEKFCKLKKIPYEIISVDAKNFKSQSKLTLEESARKLRYDAFYKVMKKDKLNKLFLAHHKNDQAETILMNILRGSGVLGAGGIREDGVIFRPLLNFKKSEILKIANEYGVKFVEDSSNKENDCTRNYLRNIVIPELEKVYPAAVDSLFSFGEKCKEMQNFVENHINFDLIDEIDDGVLVKSSVFHMNKILIREYLKLAFKKVGVNSDIETKHYELAIALSDADVNSMLNFPHGLVLKKTYGGVKISKDKAKKQVSSEYEFIVGKLEIENIGVIQTEIVEPSDIVYGEGALFVDFAKVSTKAVWRTRRFGDVFAKLGSGSKKLNDYFTDKKIDTDERDFIPILAVSNQVLVVSGYDISEFAKIDGNTDQIVKITFLKK